MNTTKFFRSIFQVLSILTVLVMVFAQAVSVSAQSAAPLTENIQIEKNGQMVTVMVVKGFDVNEFGGDDSLCPFTAEQPETIHIGEVVGSPNEKCKLVVEWSLKQDDKTMVTGVYSLEPGEWFYIPLAVAGVNDAVRVVGTLHRMPKDWNAHMYAAFIGYDRDQRDGTKSYVGLSPTDPWVLSQIDALSGRADDVVITNTPASSSTPTATLAVSTPSVEASVTPGATPAVMQPVPTNDPRLMAVYPVTLTERGFFWLAIILLGIGLAFALFRRPSAVQDAPVAPKAAAPRRKPATKKKSTKK